MSPRKALLSLGALALASTAVLSAPAIAQDQQGDDMLWLVVWGSEGAAIIALILTTYGDSNEVTPISP